MTVKQKVLVVDDEETIQDIIVYNLEQAGYTIFSAQDGISALKIAQHELPDLILLDLMLPGIDGLEVCRQLRRAESTTHIPIIILSAKSDEIDKVVGLELGADDYITKPFGRRELLARVRAVLRRVDRHPMLDDHEHKGQSSHSHEKVFPRKGYLHAGPIHIDQAGRRVYLQEDEIELQPKQFDLLTYLVKNRGTVLTREQLLNNVWGYDFAGDTRTVDVHVRWLREKLEAEPASPKLLQTVRGIGYVFRN